MNNEKSLSEIILECIVAIVFIITMMGALSMLSYSIELEENYKKEELKLQEQQIEILEKIEDKIY